MSFSKRPGKNTPQRYTKPLDSLKNWNNHFFWVDEKVFPTVVAWRMAATKDDKPKANTYSVVDVATLDTHRTPIQKQPEELLCLVGLSRNFFLHDDEYPIFLNDNDQDLFNLIKAPNPTEVKTETRQRTAHEVPLLTSTASHVIQMVDETELSTSSGTPFTMSRSPLDFSNEDAPLLVTQGAEAGVHGPIAAEQEIRVTDDVEATEAAVEPDLKKEVISMGPTIKKIRRQRDAGEGGSNAPAKVFRKDHHTARAEHSARVGKSQADMSVDTEPAIHVHETHEPPVATQSVSDQDPLSYAKPQPNPKQDVAYYADNIFSLFRGCRSSKEEGAAGNQDSKKSTPSPSITGHPEACQDVVDHIAPSGYLSELRHLPTDEFLSQYNINLARQVVMGSQLRLRFEQEAKLLKKSVAQVARRDQRIATREKHIKDLEAQLKAEINMKKSTEVKNSEAQVIGEERIMAAFEVFKKHEVGNGITFLEVIGHGLRLAVMKCAESMELRQAFSNVVSAGIAKGMSEGLKYGVEHGKAGLELTAVEAYDPEADSKYVAALHDLKDLNYPLIDELEQLKDAPLDVIMASLYLDNDTVRCLSVYPRHSAQVLDQLHVPCIWRRRRKTGWYAAPMGSHARSDGIPVSVPTVAPQGLQILLADAATQTEDEESPRLLRSKSLPPMFNLDWP
ncbi:hypothetical protein Tco_0814345 [Tanacetum coccineum]